MSVARKAVPVQAKTGPTAVSRPASVASAQPGVARQGVFANAGPVFRLSPTNTNGVVQRVPSEDNYYSGKYKDAAKAYVGDLDTSVNKAYSGIISAPMLGSLAAVDGHTLLWVEKLTKLINGEKPGNLHTTFGYVVESLATKTSLKPSNERGFKVDYQVTAGATRPDVVLKVGETPVAWIDITASASEGHIFDKVGWVGGIPNYGETLYPSVLASHIDQMRKAAIQEPKKELTGDFDAKAIIARLKEAKQELARRRPIWKAYLLEWLKPALSISQQLDATPRMVAVMKILNAKLSLTLTGNIDSMRTAASVVRAVGLNPRNYGFSASATGATGVAILQDNFPEELLEEEVEEESTSDVEDSVMLTE